MKCSEHPHSKAVDTCSVCGNGVCANCRSANQGETLCPDCMEKQYGIAHHISTSDINNIDATRSISKKASVIITITMTILYIGTLFSYFLSWKGGALSISAVVFLLISLIFQVILLLRNATKARWGVAVATLINVIFAVFYALQFSDSTGVAGMFCMMILFPLALLVALYDVVSVSVLGVITVIAWILLFGITMMVAFSK